ncbi:hypothetical protein E4U33_002583 [Claviceps sp. LM78 group G4]|nr:hypothetical protein E4U33_002583 [Claviceps sp. LM78 group G4]
MHTDAHSTSTISVAEDSADGDEIHKVLQLYRRDGEKLQSHGIWTVVAANSALEVASSDICMSVDFTGGFSNSEISARAIRIQKIKNLPIADHYTPRTIKAESDRKKATKLAELRRAECLRETEMPAVSFNMADAGLDTYCQYAAVQYQFASTAIS